MVLRIHLDTLKPSFPAQEPRGHLRPLLPLRNWLIARLWFELFPRSDRHLLPPLSCWEEDKTVITGDSWDKIG